MVNCLGDVYFDEVFEVVCWLDDVYAYGTVCLFEGLFVVVKDEIEYVGYWMMNGSLLWTDWVFE